MGKCIFDMYVATVNLKHIPIKPQGEQMGISSKIWADKPSQ